MESEFRNGWDAGYRDGQKIGKADALYAVFEWLDHNGDDSRTVTELKAHLRALEDQ